MIKLNVSINYPDTDQTVSYWKVAAIRHDHENEKVKYILFGYATANARNNGLEPLAGKAGQLILVAKNPPVDDNGDFIGRAHYNKWKNFQIDSDDLIADPTLAKGLKFEKAQALDFFANADEITGFTEE